MSKLRALFVAVAVCALSVSTNVWGQTEAKPAEQQTKSEQQAQVEPQLKEVTSKSCPEVKAADLEQATTSIANAKREIPVPIQQLLEAWLGYSKYYKHMYYTISIAIIVFGALATAFQDEAAWWRKWKTMAAVLTTISAAVNTTLTPASDYKKFDDAFVVLNTAKAAYMTNPYVTLCDVGKAVANGEAIIHKGE